MSYRTILVHVDGSEAGHAALAAAVLLARQQEASLTGLHVLMPVSVPGDNRLRLNMDMAEALARRRSEAAERAKREFQDVAGALPQAQLELTELHGLDDVPAVVARRARTADLTVVGQIGEGERVGDQPGVLPEQLVLQSGRPILVVPPSSGQKTLGERVLVGWDQSREAARAMADALPLLRRAAEVWVLTIQEREDMPQHEADGADHRAERAVAYLAAHGVKARALADSAGELDAGELLLARLSDQSADLLVLGAYGHSRLRELILGGVTRDILTHMTVPVLMSH